MAEDTIVRTQESCNFDITYC